MFNVSGEELISLPEFYLGFHKLHRKIFTVIAFYNQNIKVKRAGLDENLKQQ